jgi:hypothetical protein
MTRQAPVGQGYTAALEFDSDVGDDRDVKVDIEDVSASTGPERP